MESTMSRGKRNFLLFLISIMCQLIYIVPYIRFYFYDQYVMAYNLTNLQLGNLGSLYGLVALFSYFIGGFFADRFSIKSLMAFSFFVCAGLAFWETTFPSYNVLMVIYALFAFFNSATMWPAYIKFVRSLGTNEEQGRLYGISEALRGVLGCAAGLGLLALVVKFADVRIGVQAIIIALGISYVVFGVLSIIFLPKNSIVPELTDKDTKDEGKHATMDHFKKAIKMPELWILAIFMFACYSTFITGVNYLSTYTTQILGISPELSSALGIIRNYGILFIAGILGGFLADRSKSRIMFIVYVMAVVVILAIIMPFLKGMVTLSLVISLILPLFYYMIKAVYFSVMGDAGIPFALTGIASGILSFIAMSPDAFITTIMGAWIDQDPVTGFNKIFIWMIVWGIVAIVFALLINKRNKARKANGQLDE